MREELKALKGGKKAKNKASQTCNEKRLAYMIDRTSA